ncbi:MAG: hypothetical protein ACKOGH_00400 [Alphaproteobacteria bacterium]
MRKILAMTALLAAAMPAWAADPSAIVEDTKGKVEVEFMDYLVPGRVLKLGANDELVLGYLRSCWRETIKGGTVTVGAEQSSVAGGAVRREKVKCEGSKLKLTADQAAQSGVMVFRAPPKAGAPATPEITIHGLSPVLDIKGGGKVTIARLDAAAPPMTFDVAAQQLARGSMYDLARDGRALAAGGTYRASVGTRQVVFRVDPNAQPGRAPVVGRLLRL